MDTKKVRSRRLEVIGVAMSKIGGYELDRALDLIFAGRGLSNTAERLGMSVEALKRRFSRLILKSPADYIPYRRIARRGLPFTKAEKKVMAIHAKRKIATMATARVLQREPNEIQRDWSGEITIDRFRQVAPRVDVILAYRFLFYCSKVRLISDQAYDTAKYEEMEFGGGMDILSLPASDKPCDYPAHIRSLAFYMHFKSMEKTGNWDQGKLPPDFFKNE